MLTYLVIGIAVLTYCHISRAIREFKDFKKDILEYPICWLISTIICIMLWPVLVAWAIYDAIKMLKTEEEL